MDYLHTLQRLRNHANVAGSTLPQSESFLFALWKAKQQSHPPALQSLFDDILSCLEAVNHALNTNHPSENVSGKEKALPRSLVADVSAILSVGWHDYWQWSSTQKFAVSYCTDLALILVQIGAAWDAVLVGDFDDIRPTLLIENDSDLPPR
jgi:hypothetical protein